MPVEYKDYYRALGVSTNASHEDIRRAFRRLARQCHPDLAGDKLTADSQFKEINEAYEVLSDPDKRQTYDSFINNWPPGVPPQSAPGSAPAPDHARTHLGTTFQFRFGGTGFSDFFEQLFGTGAPSGAVPPRPNGTAPANSPSKGEDVESDIMVSLLEVLHGSIRPVSLQREVPCGHCYGTGAANSHVCPLCEGRKHVPRRDKYQVRIPAGVREGQRLRIPGQGDNGPGSAQPGDLFLRVRYAKHPDFDVQGSNLLYELEIAPWEAVLGGQASVPTLDRKQVSIRIPAGAQTGQKLRVREEGLPGPDRRRGDLLVQLRVKLPDKLTDRERALWVQLAAESGFRPRA